MGAVKTVFGYFGYVRMVELLEAELRARREGFEQGCEWCGRKSTDVWNPPFCETRGDLSTNVVVKGYVRRKRAGKAAEINPLPHEQTK